MMMRRYADAIWTLTNILLYVQSTKTMFQTKLYKNDQINKQRINESLLTTLKDKNYSEKKNKVQRGELSEFDAGLSHNS